MRELYERILQSLFEANHLSTTEEQARYLENLRPAVVRLWDAYQRQEGIQNATHYDDLSTQAAYLLRYFPSYTQPIRETLLAFAREITSGLNVERVRVAFFGSGPEPELFGLLQFLRSNASAARIVEARLYDVAAGPWLPSREINLNRLVPLAWGVNRIETQSVELDLSRPNGIRELGGLDFSVLHLAVFQNCLNEIAPNSYAAVCENIAQLLRFMPTGSL